MCFRFRYFVYKVPLFMYRQQQKNELLTTVYGVKELDDCDTLCRQ